MPKARGPKDGMYRDRPRELGQAILQLISKSARRACR